MNAILASATRKKPESFSLISSLQPLEKLVPSAVLLQEKLSYACRAPPTTDEVRDGFYAIGAFHLWFLEQICERNGDAASAGLAVLGDLGRGSNMSAARVAFAGNAGPAYY